MPSDSRGCIEKILAGSDPGRFVYSPNYWQWFAHHSNHGTLPDELAHCTTQLEMLEYLGTDIFSRNIYSNQDEYWFGGLCTESYGDFSVRLSDEMLNGNKLRTKEYRNKDRALSEKLLYVFPESTIVQNQFLNTDYTSVGLLEELVSARKWHFQQERFREIQSGVSLNGIVIAGELFSPLKMLHLVMGPVNSVYFLMEYPETAQRIMNIHEGAQLELLQEILEAGVKVVMSMDNLDTMFHTPQFVEAYSAAFYEKAASACHEKGARFLIHACGSQRDNLKLIASLRIDGLEGVAFPPLGDVTLEEVAEMTPDNFIFTGGISAFETMNLRTRHEIFSYVKKLFQAMRPFRHRFIFSSSCNTAINAPWETVKLFRDAWMEYC